MSLKTRIEALATRIGQEFKLKANLNSPAFTGTPTVPTATPGTNTTQAASTAFVAVAVAAASGGGEYSLSCNFTLSETMVAQSVALLKSDGKIEKIKLTSISESVPLGSSADHSYSTPSIIKHPTKEGKFIAYYTDQTTGYGAVKIGTISADDTVSYGSATITCSLAVGSTKIVGIPGTSKFIVVFLQNYGNFYGQIGQVNEDDTFTFGAYVNVGTYFDSNYRIAADKSGTFFLIAYSYNVNTNSRIGLYTISGTTLAVVNSSYINRAYSGRYAFAADPDEAGKFYYVTGSNSLELLTATASGITSTTTTTVFTHNYPHIAMLGGSSFVITGQVSTTTKCCYVSRSGNTFTVQTAVQAASIYGYFYEAVVDPNTPNRFIIIFPSPANSYNGYYMVGTLTGTTLTFSSPVNFTSDTLASGAEAFIFSAFIPSKRGRFVFSHYNTTNNLGKIRQGQLSDSVSNLKSDSILGILAAAGTVNESKKVYLHGGIAFGFSGLTVGNKYYVQDDGTINTTLNSSSVYIGKAISSSAILLKSYL